MLSIVALSAFAVLAEPQSQSPRFPEVEICNAKYGDVESLIYEIKQRYDAEDDYRGGKHAIRFKLDEKPNLFRPDQQYFIVRFITIDTSYGTRLIAELYTGTLYTEKKFTDAEITGGFQALLNEFGKLFPCQPAP